MSSSKFGSGRGRLIGQSYIHSFPIALDPAQYQGATIYADTGDFFFSDGADWRIPSVDVDISRPSPLVPTNGVEQTQLRLSTFRSPGGFTQTGMFFEINTDGVQNFSAGANLITRTVSSVSSNLYQILYPEDGFSPGDTIAWRARYLGTDGTQSDFSLPYSQVYPEFITDPVAITREGAVTGILQVTPFESAFGLNYVGTQIEIYQSDGVTLFQAFTSVTGGSTPVPTTVPEGGVYVWRARYTGRVGATGPVLETAWTEKRSFLNGARSMILVYDPALAVARTISLPMNGVVNVTVNWGDGTSNVYTSAGTRTKTYAAGVTGPVTVTISGQLTSYGFGTVGAIPSQQGLLRVDNFGFDLGLTSLPGAFRGTTASFSFVSPNLPPQITDLSGLFQQSFFTADITNLDVSNVQNFSQMFDSSTEFNQNISGWDTSSATNMRSMFATAFAFNQPIGAWNTSNVTNMEQMFYLGLVFNQNIGGWDVSKVTNMGSMFLRCFAFNNGGSPSINNWNTANVTNMSRMFDIDSGNGVFNQPIGNWNTANVTTMERMITNQPNFNQPIGGWNVSKVTNMLNMLNGATSFNQPLGGWNVSLVTNMGGMFARAFAFNQPIGGWNVGGVTNMVSMFNQANAFNQNIGAWSVGNVTNMAGMFDSALVFNNGGSPSINNWNTANVTNMTSMFVFAFNFNQPIGNWNTANVTNMSGIFFVATSFNQDISAWNTSNVSNMRSMFSNATAFNQPLGSWNVSAATNMEQMFNAANAFNRDISTWDLNNGVVNLNSFGLNVMSAENYSRMLVGWANRLALDDGPYNLTMGVAATRQYNSTVYAAGSRFTNAVDARAFLVGARVVSVTGASDTNANTTYTYNATTLRYTAANNWYFATLGTSWGLYNASNVLQATGTGTAAGSGPQTATSWSGVLSTATVLRTGAGWTITGDAAV